MLTLNRFKLKVSPGIRAKQPRHSAQPRRHCHSAALRYSMELALGEVFVNIAIKVKKCFWTGSAKESGAEGKSAV